MDLVGYSKDIYDSIESVYRTFAAQIGLEKIQAIPVSAVFGDNIVEASGNMTWYTGPTLMHFLETVPTEEEVMTLPFRMPVQWVNRPSHEFRGFAGMIASGSVRPGDRVRVLPSGRESEVDRIVTWDGDLDRAVTGQSVTLTLNTEIDVSRGDVLSAAAEPAPVADQFEATIVWMHDEPMLPGRTYVLKIGAKSVQASVGVLKYRINVNSLEHVAAERLELNDIGVVEIQLDHPIPFQPYKESRALGGFVLIDRLSHNTIGAGMLHFSLWRADNVPWQTLDVNKKIRARQKKQQACLLWFTGLSGSGKSTVANLVEKRLVSMDRHTYLLDGDNIRHGLSKDLGFTPQDRVENIRRVAEVAKLMVDAGLIVMTSFISPFRAERQMVRDLLEPEEFLEVFIDVPLAIAEQRDPKGLYKKARRGELKNFTGIDSPYETPENPDIRLDTTTMSAQEAANAIIELMTRRNILQANDATVQNALRG